MLDQLKYFDGELDDIDDIPDAIKEKHKTVFGVGYDAIIDAAARRQKWIDQSQSRQPLPRRARHEDLSHMYRRAWHTGLKTTYYLRTLQASNVEKSTLERQKGTTRRMATQPPPPRNQRREEGIYRSRSTTPAPLMRCSMAESARPVSESIE